MNTTNSESTNLPARFESFAILELMGHRKLAGFVQECELAGGKFLRIDVPDHAGKFTTQFYAPHSVYCLTPTTEDVVKAYAARNAPAPVNRYELELPEKDRDEHDLPILPDESQGRTDFDHNED